MDFAYLLWSIWIVEEATRLRPMYESLVMLQSEGHWAAVAVVLQNKIYHCLLDAYVLAVNEHDHCK